MPRHAKANQHLRDAMPETRATLASVVAELANDGVKQQQVAQASGWTGAYLSQFLKKGEGEEGERTPAPAKIEALLRALHVLLDVHRPTDRDQHARLRQVADLYGVRLLSMAPPSAPIPSDAPNFVDRPDVTAFIAAYARRPGTYAFDGAPMSGLSTSLLQAERALADEGYEVCSIDIKEQLLVPGLLEASATGMLGALAATMLLRADAGILGADFFSVQDAIRQHLCVYPNGFALLFDNLDSLGEKHGVELASALRNWSTLRARREDGFTRLTVWSAFTSNIEDARERSRFLPDDTKVIKWFDRGQVGDMASALVPVASAARAPLEWAKDVADAAWELFQGQPKLTHQFVWDSASAGKAISVEEDPLPGPYLAHLDGVVKNTVDLLGERGAKEAIECLQARTAPPAMFADLVRVRLHLNSSLSPSEWLPPFYRAHLAARLDYRLTANERGRVRSDR
jgi:hypothetical protein